MIICQCMYGMISDRVRIPFGQHAGKPLFLDWAQNFQPVLFSTIIDNQSSDFTIDIVKLLCNAHCH